MPPKLTKEIIHQRIYKEGYVCTGYDVKTRKFEYICPKGCNGSTRMDHWNRGVRCPCVSGNKKLTLEFIKSEFLKETYKVLSNKYVNSKSHLSVICPKGHIYLVKYENWRSGHRCSKCYHEKIKGKNNPYITSGAFNRYDSKKHYNWKGGVAEKNIPLHTTYAERLSPYHKVKSTTQNGLELVSVACIYCGNFHVPNLNTIVNRLNVIKGKIVGHGEYNFYCSEGCKKACPIYNQKKYPKGFKKSTSREVQPQLRKLVLKRDDYKCQICEVTSEEVQLHCHHITGVEQNPIESADIDNCITLCKKHHKQVHKLPYCGYNELRCNKLTFSKVRHND